MTGGMFSLKGKTQIDFKDLSFSLLPMRQQGKFLQDQMETSLGSSFAWSASQTKVMDVFQQFLKYINFEKGSLLKSLINLTENSCIISASKRKRIFLIKLYIKFLN